MNTMELSPQAKALARAKSRVATYTEKLAEARRELAAAEKAHRDAIVADLADGTPSDTIGDRHGVTGSRVRQIRAAELNRRAAS
jgi:hypothetical protein